MQLSRKENPVGVDAAIDKIQLKLFTQLMTRFSWNDYDSFHRAYKNRKEENVIPEIYTIKNEYEEVLFNDKVTVTSFFLVEDKRSYDQKTTQFTQGVSIIFQARLDKLFPSITHRADEEMIDNIFQALRKSYLDRSLFEIVTGVEKVYESLKLNFDKKYWSDISNFFVVRLNFKLIYLDTDCVATPNNLRPLFLVDDNFDYILDDDGNKIRVN